MVISLGKTCDLAQWLIFILFSASFSTPVTKIYPIRNRGASRTRIFKMELFVAKVNDMQSLTFVTKSSILLYAIALDTPLRKIYAHFFRVTLITDTAKYK